MNQNVIPHEPEVVQCPHENGYHPPGVPLPDAGRDDGQLEQALRQAQTNLLRYQELFEFAPNGYLVTDSQGVILEINHAAAALLGGRKQFLVGKPLLFYVADRRAFVTNLYRVNHRPEGPVQWEMTLRPPWVDPLYVLVTVAFASTEALPAGLRWVLQDITRRRQAEETLKAEKEFADSLIELAEAAILVLDYDGRILRANRFFLSLLGHPHGLDGQFLTDLWLPEDRPFLRRGLDNVTTGDVKARGTHRVRTKDGVTRTLAWSAWALPVTPPRPPCVLFVANDITDLQQAQRRLVQAERLAAIGEMVAGLAHESRNALQRSQACLSMLEFRLRDQPEALDLLARAQKAQDDLHRLFDDVRAYAGPIRLEPCTCDVVQVWREAWQDVAAARAVREAELHEDIETTDHWCEASPFHLRQVFRNLLDNALSVTNGPARITVRCTAARIDGREGLRIAIEDNGPGFTPEQRQKAFEPFFTTKVHGTGLGLSICKRLVEAHGGQITVGDRGGPGAVVVVTLPRRTT